jgi:hypothetical protein
MKTFRTQLVYDAEPAQVLAMLAEPAFREKVAHAQHAVSADVTVTRQGEGFTMVSTQEQDTSGLPAIAQKFVGATTTSVVTEQWADGTAGTITIEAPGKPITSSGTVTLGATGAGTTQTVEVEVKVRIPVVGGKLESLVVDALDAGYRKEQQVGTAWLRGER